MIRAVRGVRPRETVICRDGGSGDNVYPSVELAVSAAQRSRPSAILFDGAVTLDTPGTYDVTNIALLGATTGSSSLTLGDGVVLAGLSVLDRLALISVSTSPIFVPPAGTWQLYLHRASSLTAGAGSAGPMIDVSGASSFLGIQLDQYAYFFRLGGRILKVHAPASALIAVGPAAQVLDGSLDGDGAIEVDDFTGQALGAGNSYVSHAHPGSNITYA